MSEDPTKPTLEAVLKEMRIGFASIDERLQKLEARQYDTKPIWENALKEIADTRQEMRERFDDLSGSVTVLSGDVVGIRSAILHQKRVAERVEAEPGQPRAQPPTATQDSRKK